MKKNLFKVLSLVLVALFAMTCVASAASLEGIYANGTVTATVTGVGTTDEVTILVVPHGTELASVKPDAIIYIDQVTAANGTATFSFASSTEAIDIYSGYTSMTIDKALDQIYEPVEEPPVVEPTAPEIDTAKTKMYSESKPFGLTGYKRIFVKLVEGNGAWMPAHIDAESEIYYSTEREGYDGLIKTTAGDIAAALGELTWENVAPTDEQTIAMYGDSTVTDKKITIADANKVVRYYLKKDTATKKLYLVSDADNNAKLSIADANKIVRKYLKKDANLTVVEDR